MSRYILRVEKRTEWEGLDSEVWGVDPRWAKKILEGKRVNEHTLREIYRKKIPDDVKRTYRTYISFRRYFFQLDEGEKRSKNRERTIGENEAWGIITNGCSEIRKRASFFISPRCEFRILNVKAINLEESSSRVEIDTFSQGHMYSITFKAVYNIYWSSNNTYTVELLEVIKT